MLSQFQFRGRGGVLSQLLGISTIIAMLFVAGCGANGGATFTITTSSGQLVTVIINSTYPTTTFAAANGTGAETWAWSGNTPPGLSLSPAGVLSGSPTSFGTFNFTVTVTDSATPTPHTATANLSISINPAITAVALNPTAVTGGTSSTATVTLSGAAAAAAAVTLSSSSASATVPATVTVAAGATTANFQVTTSAVSSSTSATITATYGVAKTANLALNAPTVTSVTLAQSTVTGGQGTTGTVTLTGPAATGGDTVALSSNNSSAQVPATVTVAAGATTAQFNVTTSVVASNATATIQASFNSSMQSAPLLTVVPAPVITSFTSLAATITSGTSTKLTAVFVNGTGSVNNTVGAVTSGTAVTITPTATTTYTLTVTNAAGTSVTQQTTVTVVAAPVITSFTSAATTITAGTSTTLTAVFSGGTGTVNNGVGSVTSAAPVTVSPTITTTYTLTVTNAATTPATVTSTTTVTVVPAPVITSFTPAQGTIVLGGSTTLTAVFSNGTGSVDNAVGAVTSGTAVSVAPTVTTTYTLTVTNAAGTKVTATAQVIVDTPPGISSGATTTFTVGTNGTFPVQGTGNPLPSLVESGALPANVTFVDNGNGTGTLHGIPAVGTDTSSPYHFTITASNSVSPAFVQNFTLYVTLVQAPAITTNPTSQTITVGNNATFTAAANGSPVPTVQWQVSTNGGTTFTNISGATSATLTLTAVTLSQSTDQYRAVFTNSVNSATSNAATLTVVAAPAITSFTSAASTITAGSSTTLTGVFSGGTGSVNNGVGAVTSGTAVSVSPSATTTYTLTVTNSATTPATTTATVTVTVVPAPTITSFTATSTTIVAGNSTTLTPQFSNGTGSIDNGVGTVTSGTGVSVSPSTTTTYTLTVTNSAGSKTTSTVTITVHSPPMITSANSTTFTIGTAGSFTVTTTGFPVPSLTETLTLPTGVTFTDNGTGTGTLAWTAAVASGTYGLSFTASNGVGSNATQAFTLTGTNSGGQVSGQIFLNNNCGNGTQPTFTVTINTSPAQQAQTDTSGNYLFASVPNGTYTITPSIPGAASSIFYPASYTGVAINGGSVSGKNFNAVVGYNVSGTVTYTGSQTGQTYLYLQSNNCGGYGAQGTSITKATLSSGGAYTVHGVQPGSYTLYAWMDSTGITSGPGYPGPQGQPNANDPTGSNSGVSVTNANVTGVGVTLANPTYSTPTANPSLQVFPNAGGVTIFYNPPSLNTANGNKQEDANEYVVQWAVTTGTDSDGPICALGVGGQFLTVAGSHTFYANGANGATVWILNNTVAGSGTFTSGTKYCFQARAFNTLASITHPSGWGTYTDSLLNPAAVTIPTGAPSCTGTCTTMSGKVTIPSGVTIASGAPLYVGFYQQSPGSNSKGPTALYATEITSPVSGIGGNNYSIAIPSGSNYTLFGILDQNNDGQIDAGDVTNTNNNGNSSTITVSGSTMPNVNTTLPGTNSTATVQTQYSTCGTGCSNYNLNLQVRAANKLPVAVTLSSGPNLLTPVDMGECTSCGNIQFDYSASLPGGTPNVGDTYNFTVTYSDGSVDQGSLGTINGKITAFGSTGAVAGAIDAPTNLSPSGMSSTSTTPNFTWTFPSNPTSYTYSFYLSQQTNCSGNCNIWQIPGNNSNSNGFTYAQTQTGATTGQIPWSTSTDPTGATNPPSVSALTAGDTYSWSISVQDSNGNQAQTSVNYAP